MGVGLHIRCHPVDVRAVRALNGRVRPLPAHPALPCLVILTLLAVSGCPGSDDDDLTAGDDDDASEPWSVVAAGLFDGEPSRYSGQKKTVALEDGARHGLLFGRRDAPEGEGTLYYLEF